MTMSCHRAEVGPAKIRVRPLLRKKGPTLICLLLITGWLSILTSHAQSLPEDTDNAVHYSYSALLGTGYYTVGDRRVAVLQAPLSYQVRETGGPKEPGIRIKIPVSVGLYNFKIDDIPELSLDDLVTITIMPGVEFNYQINDQWAVDPAVHIGYGRDMTNSDSSLLWGGNIRSRYDFNTTKPGLTLGSEALYAGYNPDGGSSDSIVRLSLGLDVRIPTGWQIGNNNMFIATHATGFYYPVSLRFPKIERERYKTTTELEFGLALGRDPPFEVLGIKFDRVGLAYRFSDVTSSIILVTSFPF
jgi:hypothetical protein